MSTIDLDHEEMAHLMTKTEQAASDATTALNGFSTVVDGGIASDKIAFVLRTSMEGAQLSAGAAEGVCAVARLATDDHLANENDIFEALNNFTDGALG